MYVCMYAKVVCMYVCMYAKVGWMCRKCSKLSMCVCVCVCVFIFYFYACIYIYYMNVCTGLVDVTQVQRALQGKGAAVLSHSQSDGASSEAVPGGAMTSVNFGAQRQV